MSERWWNRRRKKKHPWFHFFREFDRMEKIMEEMMRQAFRPFRRPFGGIGVSKRFRPHIYGFSITLGPDGAPRIRRFGDVHRSRHGLRIGGEREPLVDVLEEKGEVAVVAELPGVEKEDINLHASEDRLIISVDTPKRRYHKELSLPEEVYPKSAKAIYKNGVLEVRLRKRGREGRGRIGIS